MNDIALVTATFGGTDAVKVLPRRKGIDAFFYTDEETKARTSRWTLASWDQIIVPRYPRDDFGPRLASRYFKHQIHRLDEVRGHRWLIWADASVELKQTGFILDQVERLRRLPRRNRVLLIPHPERGTVRDEYGYIQAQIDKGDDGMRRRYANEKMEEQMQWFRQQGWNLDAKLWCGTFWMVENNELLNRCWDDWWDQNLRWGMMDQLSLPVLLDQYACVPQSLDIDLYRNQYFTKVPHQAQISDLSRRGTADR